MPERVIQLEPQLRLRRSACSMRRGAEKGEINDTGREDYLADLVLRLASALEDCRDGGVTA